MVKVKQERLVNSEDCKFMVKVKREQLFPSDCKVSSIDRISQLPNEVLGLILSSLTFKEATATSILSRQWRYSWTFTHTLDFDFFGSASTLLKRNYRADSLDTVRFKFIAWIDRVITISKLYYHRDKPSYSHSHSHSHSLKRFNLVLDLTENHREWIDDWLSYVVSRKVESIELSLIAELEYKFQGSHHNLCYNFPYGNGNFPSNLRALKTLRTHLVNVSGEAVEMFLRNCPVLERVSVSQSRVLTSLEIARTFPAFKCLEINLCINLAYLVIRDSGIVCLKYSSSTGFEPPNFLLVDNVPLLTQLWIQGFLSQDLRHAFIMFWTVLPQLEMLKIYIEDTLSWTESRDIVSGVEMRNLKQLVVSIGEEYGDRTLLPVINLISISPRLQRFVLEASQPSHKYSKYSMGSWNLYGADWEINSNLAYFYLKEIEFVGYRGTTMQLEWIMHFVENNVLLENIIVDPRCFEFCSRHFPWERIPRHKKIEDEISARARATQQLNKHYIPRGINVKIL